MAIFYANWVGAEAAQDGNMLLEFAQPVPGKAMVQEYVLLPRRVAEALLKVLAEALMPDEPEASGEGKSSEPELPLTGDGWVDEKPGEVMPPWRARFGVES